MNNYIEELVNNTVEYQYVSFDLFDTLIFRTVPEPQAIFDLVEFRYNQDYPNKICNFRKKRHQAEFFARKKSEFNDITIDNIYDELTFDDELKEILKHYEKNIEIETCISNSDMVEVVKLCKRRSQKIVITTDMYLDKKTISEILKKIKIDYDFLFISGEEKDTKLTGRLFEIVLNKLNICASEICHIGDNKQTDIMMPASLGIMSFERISRVKELPLYSPRFLNIQLQHLNTFIKNSLQTDEMFKAENRIGYSVLGPFVYSFCKWIHEKSVEFKPDKLIFVAREGYLIKEIYDMMYPQDRKRSFYMCLNKNLIRMPALFQNPSVDTFISYIPSYRKYTWHDIFNLLFITENGDYLNILNEYGIKTLDETVKHQELKEAQFSKIFNRLMEMLHNELYIQSSMLDKYLAQNDFLHGHNFIINNSINGAVHCFLENIFLKDNHDLRITSLQFTSSEICKKNINDKIFCWFEEMHVPSFELKMIMKYCIVWEHLMFEKQGTAMHFDETDGNVKPVCDSIGEEICNYPSLENIQNQALEFARKYHQEIQYDIGKVSVHQLFLLLTDPMYEDACLIGNIIDRDFAGTIKLADYEKYKNDSILKIINVIKDNYKVVWSCGLLNALKLTMLRFFYLCRSKIKFCIKKYLQ